jgi:hypothetical protein
MPDKLVPWCVTVEPTLDGGCVTTVHVGVQAFDLARLPGSEDELYDKEDDRAHCQFIANMFIKAMRRAGAPPPSEEGVAAVIAADLVQKDGE